MRLSCWLSAIQYVKATPLYLLQMLSTASSLSPVKSRGQQLPTSPTHMAAMRGAVQQRHPQAAFEFGNQFVSQQMFMYAHGHQDTLTPSPDSPGQWSSGSPQSYSDWSDGIHSPQFAHQHLSQQHLQQPQKQQQPQQHQMLPHQADGVLI